MPNQHISSELVTSSSYDVQILDFEKGLLELLGQKGLPTAAIVVEIDERFAVFQNLDRVLRNVGTEKRQGSVYISKFVYATASGLFDAALNYLWDETISELRQRVAQYDLSYFFDNAIKNVEKRKKLSNIDDLTKIEDSELIHGAMGIGLIEEQGKRHLDYVQSMRNYASAAHPNQNRITGLQLVSWLEICIKEVITLPLSNTVGQIKQLLTNIKANSISESEAREIATLCWDLSQDQINKLVSGLFGIYTQIDTSTQTRQNIRYLLPLLWDRVDEPTRKQFGINYSKYRAIGEKERKNLAREFLELVSATPYIDDVDRIIEIEDAVENLLLAHRGLNNFYNEPPFARALQNIVGTAGKIPSPAGRVNKKYVLGVVEVFLTNGNGVTWNAEPIYRSLIDLFDTEQALIAILTLSDSNIASKLQFPICQEKYRELLQIMKQKVSAPAVKELIDFIESTKIPLDKLSMDSRFKQKRDTLLKIIG